MAQQGHHDIAKVAYVLTPIDFGGAERVSLMFLRNVDRRHFDIHIVAFLRPWEKQNIFFENLKGENFRIHTIPIASRPREQGRDYFRVLRCYKAIFALLQKENFDLVHTHGYYADTIVLPLTKLLGIPHVATCHGFIANDGNLSLYNTLDRALLKFSDKILAVSDDIKNSLIENKVKASHVTVIKNCIELTDQTTFALNKERGRNTLGIHNNDFAVGYVGRLSKEKGINNLIEASSLLDRNGIHVHTIIIGEGPEKNALESLTRSRNLDSRVHFLGFQSNPMEWLPVIDVFVLPSLTEGTPISLLEAMSCGLPVVASAVGGIPAIIRSEQNGLLVTPNKPVEIKSALTRLHDSKALSSIIGQAARKTVMENHDINTWARTIEHEYLSLLQ